MSADFHLPAFVEDAFVVSTPVLKGRPPRTLIEESPITEENRRAYQIRMYQNLNKICHFLYFKSVFIYRIMCA